MVIEKKGMLSPFTVLTSLITGSLFPLLGSLVAVDMGVVKILNIQNTALVMVGGFTAHWILAHTIHDFYHYEIGERKTFSKRTLKALFVISLIFLLSIAIYLTYTVGWLVLVFSIIGGITCIYAEGLLHHESQMAIAAFFLVIGAFYVQTGTLSLPAISFLRLISISLFAFFSQYGWLLFYRLDDYGWSVSIKNRSIILTKLGLPFLIIYFFLGSV
ncbi:MAG: hypothetical protein J7K13_00960 [Thermoplasmata archaeon]|nr:hypothetical protein [Thermoplasmata archaeon]